jgi:hypothetical protein
MIAKMLLPLLGGAPAVWSTCMVFFEAALLAGYVYAHLSTRYLTVRTQAVDHSALILCPLLVLPLAISRDATAGWPADANPVFHLLWLLTTVSPSSSSPPAHLSCKRGSLASMPKGGKTLISFTARATSGAWWRSLAIRS